MKLQKLTIIIVILVAVIGLGAADFLLNQYRGNSITSSFIINKEDTEIQQTLFKDSFLQQISSKKLQINEKSKTEYLFMGIQLDFLSNFKGNKYIVGDKKKNVIFTLYEIATPPYLGGIAYYKIKERLLAIANDNLSINETNEFGNNSLYLNDNTRAEATFLLVQIKDYIFGFEYLKGKDSLGVDRHSVVKEVISKLQKKVK